jgi:hypothetical protein
VRWREGCVRVSSADMEGPNPRGAELRRGEGGDCHRVQLRHSGVESRSPCSAPLGLGQGSNNSATVSLAIPRDRHVFASPSAFAFIFTPLFF